MVTNFAAKKTLLVVTLTLLSNFTQTSSAGLFDELKEGVGNIEQVITDGNEFIKKSKEAPDNMANQNQAPINNVLAAELPPSSQEATYADANIKTNIYVTDPNLNVFRRVIEAAMRASSNLTKDGGSLPLQLNKYVHFKPVKYECRILQWRGTDNPKAISNKAQSGGFKGIKSANIEFIGVQPTTQKVHCMFDEAKIIGNYKKVATSTNQPVTPTSNYGSRHFDSMIVSVFKFQKSHLEMCIDKYGDEVAKKVCNMNTPRDTAPSIVFRISYEEMARIGLRAAANTKTAYWKAAFTPKNVESLSGGKKVKLMNVNMHDDRGDVFFESLKILE